MRTAAIILVCLASASAGKAFDLTRLTTEVVRGTPHPATRVVTEDCPDPLHCER